MNQNIKEISDANLLSFLLTAGFKPIKRVSYQGRLALQFQRTDELEKACADFYDKKTSVDALTLLETYHTIKQMVRELGR